MDAEKQDTNSITGVDGKIQKIEGNFDYVDDVESAASSAFIKARSEKSNVVLHINGIELNVTPDTRVKNVISDYYVKLAKQDPTKALIEQLPNEDWRTYCVRTEAIASGIEFP